MSRNNGGFTLVEIVVVLTVAGVLTSIVFGIFGDIYHDNLNSIGRSIQNVTIRSSLHAIKSDLSRSTGFASRLNGLPAPFGSDGGDTWDYVGDAAGSRVLIAGVPATGQASADGARRPVFRSDCVTPIRIKYVYFLANKRTVVVSDDTSKDTYGLYRRTIVDDTSATCAAHSLDVAQRSTCEASAVASGSGCHQADALLLDGVTRFCIDYYLSSSVSESDAVADCDDPGSYGSRRDDIGSASAIRVRLDTFHMVAGRQNDESADIRIRHQ